MDLCWVLGLPGQVQAGCVLGLRGFRWFRAYVRDCNSTPSRFRTLSGLTKPYIVLISSLKSGGVPLEGTLVIPFYVLCRVSDGRFWGRWVSLLVQDTSSCSIAHTLWPTNPQ